MFNNREATTNQGTNLKEQLLFELTRLQSTYNLEQALEIKVHGLPEAEMETRDWLKECFSKQPAKGWGKQDKED